LSLIPFFVAEAEVKMQQITLCFCATLGVLLAISSFVNAQEVVYISDADINPVETVSLAPAFAYTVL
jgi:hypothetical protein